MDYSKRDCIIFGKIPDYSDGGVADFENLSSEKFKELVQNNFLEMDEVFNTEPPCQEILDIIYDWKKNEKGIEITLDGYAVSPLRDDTRISFKAIKIENRNYDFTKNFLTKLMKFAIEYPPDIVSIDKAIAYFWWD